MVAAGTLSLAWSLEAGAEEVGCGPASAGPLRLGATLSGSIQRQGQGSLSDKAINKKPSGTVMSTLGAVLL